MRDVPWKAIDQPVHRKMHQAQKIKSLVKKGTDKGRLCINEGRYRAIWYASSSEEKFLPLCATQLSCYLLWLPLKMGQQKGISCWQVKSGRSLLFWLYLSKLFALCEPRMFAFVVGCWRARCILSQTERSVDRPVSQQSAKGSKSLKL